MGILQLRHSGAGIDHLVPFNIANDGPTIPDFTSGRINKTISWFSPGTIRKFDGFKILVSALSEAVSIPENTVSLYQLNLYFHIM